MGIKPKVKNEAGILMWLQLKEIAERLNSAQVAIKEFRFAPPRKWKFDFAIYGIKRLANRYAIEIEGGAFTQGRHTRGVGFIKDMEKYNHAALMGWRVLRFTPSQVLDGTAIAFIKQVLES